MSILPNPVVKIYTRKGDDGSTGLWYGGRVPKSGGRPEAYGAVDEAASALGLCRAAAKAAHQLTIRSARPTSTSLWLPIR